MKHFVFDNMVDSTEKMLNCPNCGAPITAADHCEYCGTSFIDCTMDLDDRKPFYIKVRHNGRLNIVRVYLEQMSSCREDDGLTLYADNMTHYYMRAPVVTFDLRLRMC